VRSGKLHGCSGEFPVANDQPSGALVMHRTGDNLLDSTYTNHLAEPFALHGDALTVPLGDHVNAEITGSGGH
jgi:hypothetical protein